MELLAVVVILAVLAAVAVPRYYDYAADAKDSADEGALAGIRTALITSFGQNRMTNAPSSQWVDGVDDIAGTLDTGQLPQGITIAGTKLQDSRGNTYTLTAETAAEPARLTKD